MSHVLETLMCVFSSLFSLFWGPKKGHGSSWQVWGLDMDADVYYMGDNQNPGSCRVRDNPLVRRGRRLPF